VTDQQRSSATLPPGVDPADVVEAVPLSGGTYNALTRVTLRDGGEVVVKVPPAVEVPGLAYEQDLLASEILYYTSAATVGADVPVPEVVSSSLDPDRPFLVMSLRPGVPWSELREKLEDGEQRRLRRELGGLIARLHTVKGREFGYPGGRFGGPAASWRAAFGAMTAGVLADAERYGAWLPETPDRIRELLAAVGPALDAVTVPALVHYDLWEGNVLLDGPPGERVVSGIIDGERMFWGDPLAEFVSPALLGDITQDPDFLAGYAAAAGAPVVLDDAALLRLSAYRVYLYLIMVVESVPRGYDADHLVWVRDNPGRQLVVELERIAAATGASR
jgi:aminoglycoside phosphotransferase (APT) family kinase protein